MTHTEMRSLTAEEIDSVVGAGGGFTLPSINVIIAPQVNAGISAAISIFGNAKSSLDQLNLGIAGIQSNLKLG